MASAVYEKRQSLFFIEILYLTYAHISTKVSKGREAYVRKILYSDGGYA